MKLTTRIFGLFLSSLSSPAWPDGFGAIASVSNYYFYRGYSKTVDGASLRGNLDYGFSSGFYGGIWVSRLDLQEKKPARRPRNKSGQLPKGKKEHIPLINRTDSAQVEMYPYIGFNFKLNEDWRLDTSVSRYIFDGRLGGKYSDYNEYSMSLNFKDIASARVDFADNAYNRGRTILNYDVSARYPIYESISVSGGLGYNQAIPVLEWDTFYWHFGLTWYFKHVALDLRYYDYSWSATTKQPYFVDLPVIPSSFSMSLSIGL